MLVYGDPQFEITLGEAVRLACQQIDKTSINSVGELRTLLIQLGQLEQGISDTEHCAHARKTVERATDLAAEAFCSAYGRENSSIPAVDSPITLSNLKLLLSSIEPCETPLTIKIPEGFAFYAVYPEQYCLATIAWHQKQSSPAGNRVLVIGLRSIGTSLSAVVTATLKLLNYEVQRITVRPSGPPFEREVEFSVQTDAQFALVVDEGPGISGSSMAIVAETLCGCGFSLEKIIFFPGHTNLPTAPQREMTRQIWNSVSRYVTDISEVSWNRKTLQERLAKNSSELTNAEVISIKDLGKGLWREHVFKDNSNWPAVFPSLDRAKFLVETANRSRILWKFYGLCFAEGFHIPMAEQTSAEMNNLAQHSLIPAPLACVDGFVAMHWKEDQRLTKADVENDAIFQEVVRYIVNASGPVLSDSENNAALTRIRKILYWNTAKAIDTNLAQRLNDWAEWIRVPAGFPRYGDGRMAMYEWVQTSAGMILKTNGVMHHCDHMYVGIQPIHWDIAGVIVEWDLNSLRKGRLISLIRRFISKCTPEQIEFYCCAYAAFRLGICVLAAEAASILEKQRLSSAAGFYRRRLLSASSKYATNQLAFHQVD